MAYFKIGNTDYSKYVNALSISKSANYNAQMNAAGDTVVDYINHKRIITVGIIPLNDTVMAQLQTDLDAFSVSISFKNPMTNALEENVACIVPVDEVKYYTIQANKVLFNAFEIKFIEL